MPTKDIVDELINISQEKKPITCSKVPTNVSHNTLFIVDTWKLNDFWDIKCDDMGSWKNNGRKRSKTGVPGMAHDVYRQFYSNSTVPSVKKSLVYLQCGGNLFRYVAIQYVFSEKETTIDPKPHGLTKNKDKDKGYKRTMPSTIAAIKSSTAKPREIIHSIIDARGGIECISNAGEYPRNREQVYRVQTRVVKPSTVTSKDPLIELLQLSKEQQQQRKEDWFVRRTKLCQCFR